MALLNRKIDYALLILCYLHHKADGGCAREIAGHFGLSRPFVANILKEFAPELERVLSRHQAPQPARP